MKNIITIGRQFGSGGRIIGRLLAKRFGFAYYDKELISLAAKESGISPKIFEMSDEMRDFNFFDNFFNIQYSKNYLGNDSLFEFQSEIIRELATAESCVFVGRCADYILRDHPGVLNVFITAEHEDRVRRVTERENISPKDAWAHAEKIDKKRKEYYNFYSNKDWGNASTYHLAVNSSTLGLEKTADFIYNFAKEKFSLT